MTEAAEKRSNFFQVIITIILTVIGILLVFVWDSLDKVLENQIEAGKEMVRLKTTQDENVLKVNYHINKDEINNMKAWVDENYIRKSQK